MAHPGYGGRALLPTPFRLDAVTLPAARHETLHFAPDAAALLQNGPDMTRTVIRRALVATTGTVAVLAAT
jgi:hypothetical protein